MRIWRSPHLLRGMTTAAPSSEASQSNAGAGEKSTTRNGSEQPALYCWQTTAETYFAAQSHDNHSGCKFTILPSTFSEMTADLTAVERDEDAAPFVRCHNLWAELWKAKR